MVRGYSQQPQAETPLPAYCPGLCMLQPSGLCIPQPSGLCVLQPSCLCVLEPACQGTHPGYVCYSLPAKHPPGLREPQSTIRVYLIHVYVCASSMCTCVPHPCVHVYLIHVCVCLIHVYVLCLIHEYVRHCVVATKIGSSSQ